MKLSKTMKKFVAVISAIAMVIAGITYTPQAVRADIDYASLTYTQATPNGEAPDLYYSIVENSIGGWATPWYGDAGNTFQIVFSADNKAKDTVIKVNDVETTSGVVTLVGLGLIKLNPTQMADNAYTKVEVTATTGTATIVFRKGTPGTVETTTVAPAESDTTTVAPAESDTTTVAPAESDTT